MVKCSDNGGQVAGSSLSPYIFTVLSYRENQGPATCSRNRPLRLWRLQRLTVFSYGEAARHHLIHGPVPVRGSGVADHWYRARLRRSGKGNCHPRTIQGLKVEVLNQWN
ncbi:hypothetical protein TNCV_34831 [Trichonephila clavipes]|nr:hypothetical protein TNCV_34831 [Trichonephila clavipes]